MVVRRIEVRAIERGIGVILNENTNIILSLHGEKKI